MLPSLPLGPCSSQRRLCFHLALLSTFQSFCGGAPLNDTSFEDTSVIRTNNNDTALGGPFDPDYVDCSPIYGDSLVADNCKKAVKNIFAGRTLPRPISLSRKGGTGAFSLQVPHSWKDDENIKTVLLIWNVADRPTCVITIDLAGPPAEIGEGRYILSSSIKSNAKKVIEQCVEKSTWAGYATSGMEKSGMGLYEGSHTKFKAPPFITITVAPPDVPNRAPGDTDPTVPLALTVPLDGYRRQALLPSTREKTTVLINQLEYQSSRMVQGGRQTWWDTEDFQEIVPGGVDYQCHEKFGAPGVMQLQQCKKASWNFIKRGNAPDIRPGTPITFQEGQCIFKAEALHGTVQIEWEAMRAAVDTLLYTCLESQTAPLSGGQVVFIGGPSSSKTYGWPDNLLITMGDAGLVSQTANVTTSGSIEPVGRTNISDLHPLLSGSQASSVGTS